MLTRNKLNLLLSSGEITQEDYEALLVDIVPSVWIETHICNYEIVPDASGYNPPLILRWYQRQIINDEAPRKVLRVGRQAGKSHLLTCDSIYHTRVYTGTTAIIVVPYNHQCLLLYDKIVNFIKASPLLDEYLLSSTKNPFVITWKDGGKIKLFTAGASSGGTADSVRGQTARWLYVDEADYIPETALDSILMTTAAFGNDARIVMSSTPQGPKTYFFDMCHNKRWKEFHFASHVSPTWTEDMDKTARDTLGETGYSHEVLAEFSDAERGIFKKEDVLKAFRISMEVKDDVLRSYTYEDESLLRPYMKTFIIGVDWNSVLYGTQIVILGVSQDVNKLYLIKHIEISSEQFTQMSAVETIAELITKYDPLYVYVDEGYGSMQIEVMHRMGTVNESIHMDERLVGINFSSNLEVWDPIANEMKQKYAKGFMVDNMSRIVEQNMIHFPTDELITSGGNARKKLEAIMAGYILKRISPNGKPVYECQGAEDHKLDALMLAGLAYTQHYKQISDKNFGLKPVQSVTSTRSIFKKEDQETYIVSRSLNRTMNKGRLERYSYNPAKEDYNDFTKRVAGIGNKVSQRNDRAKTASFARIMSGNIVRRSW